MNQYKLVVFDWDGTLMDSIGRIVSSMQAAAYACQQDIPSVAQVKNVIGLSLPKVFDALFPSASGEDVDALRAQYKHQYLKGDNTPAPLFSDARPLLNALLDDNKLLAVATGKAREGLDRVMASTQTTHLFHTSRCADETLSKPKPQMLLSVLDELNVLPEHAVMVGDSSFDLEMAQAAGVDSIGVTLGVHDRDMLNRYQPKAVVDSLTELQQLLLPVMVETAY